MNIKDRKEDQAHEAVYRLHLDMFVVKRGKTIYPVLPSSWQYAELEYHFS